MNNFNQKRALVSDPRKPREYEMLRKHKRTLKKAIAIRGCSVTFNLSKAPEDQDKYLLKVDKVNDVPLIERTEESDAEQLPVTNLLEQWYSEVRRRDNGRLDRVYWHPISTKRYRSLKEVSKFIEEEYYLDSSEKLQIKPPKGTIPLDRMRVLTVKEETLDIDLNEEVQSNFNQDEIPEVITFTNHLRGDIDLNVEPDSELEEF